MAITITRDLNVVSVGVPPVIHLSQYDSNFTLVFNLYASTGAFTMPTGTTAEIRGTKRDGNGYDAAATVSGSTVTVTGDEQMTAVAGQNVFEIATYYNNKRLNTINFILDVERAALDADTITSESVLRELNAIIEGAATATQAAEDAEDAADRAEEAAQSIIITDRVKEALMDIVNNVAWTGDDPTGQSYINALYSALYTAQIVSISAVFTQGNNAIFDSDSLDDLRQYLVVTAHYDDDSSGTVTDYTLSGSLSSSTSTITVTYAEKTTTFTVSVTMPVFDYKASRDGLLSAQSVIITDTNDANSFSERITSSGNLRLEGTSESETKYYQFKIGENPTTGKWRMRVKVMFYSLSSTYAGGFRPNVSNGSSGMRIATKSVNGGCTIFAYEGNTSSSVASGLTVGSAEQWYNFELFIDSSEPVQVLRIDGEDIFESAIFATAPKNNSIFIVGKCLIFIDTIKLYNA